MLLIKCYRIMKYQKRFIDSQKDREMSFSKSETVRHAAMLLLTVIEKRGYLPGGIFLEDTRKNKPVVQFVSKFPNQMMNKILIAMDLYGLTFSAFMRVALDTWISWQSDTLTPEQESYIPRVSVMIV